MARKQQASKAKSTKGRKSTKSTKSTKSKSKTSVKSKAKVTPKVVVSYPAPDRYEKGQRWTITGNDGRDCRDFVDFLSAYGADDFVVNPFSGRSANVGGAAIRGILKQCKVEVPGISMPSWYTERGSAIDLRDINEDTAKAAIQEILDVKMSFDKKNVDNNRLNNILDYDGSAHNRNHNLETLLYIAGTRSELYNSQNLKEWSSNKSNKGERMASGVSTKQGKTLTELIEQLGDGEYESARANFINDMFFSKSIAHPTGQESNLPLAKKKDESSGPEKRIVKTYKKYGNPTVVNIAHALGFNYTATCAASLGLMDNIDINVTSDGALDASMEYYEEHVPEGYRVLNYATYLPIAISSSLSAIIENGYSSVGTSKTSAVRKANFSAMDEGAEDDLGTRYFKYLRSKMVTRLFNPITNANSNEADVGFLNTLRTLEERLFDVTGKGEAPVSRITIVDRDQQVVKESTIKAKSPKRKTKAKKKVGKRDRSMSPE